jgi:hypothetical protein
LHSGSLTLAGRALESTEAVAGMCSTSIQGSFSCLVADQTVCKFRLCSDVW